MSRWELWYAWHPVWIKDELVWFETVERRLYYRWQWFFVEFEGPAYEYRLVHS